MPELDSLADTRKDRGEGGSEGSRQGTTFLTGTESGGGKKGDSRRTTQVHRRCSIVLIIIINVILCRFRDWTGMPYMPLFRPHETRHIGHNRDISSLWPSLESRPRLQIITTRRGKGAAIISPTQNWPGEAAAASKPDHCTVRST